jgi:hypothetical protein
MTPLMPPENSNLSAEEAAQAMDAWNMRVQQEAREFIYPPTPDLAGSMRQALIQRTPRRLPVMARWAAALVLVMLLALAGVPQLRAVVLEMLRVGAVRIFFVEPTATATDSPSVTVVSEATILPDALPVVTLRPTLMPSPVPLQSVLDLSGETTLEDVRMRVPFDIRLPTYPASAGLPDHVFLQNERLNPVVALVWLKPPELVTPDSEDQQVWFSLWILDRGAFSGKFTSTREVSTTVNNVYMPGNDPENPHFERFVLGNVLIWEGTGVTYRLETELPMEEARHIAESLR